MTEPGDAPFWWERPDLRPIGGRLHFAGADVADLAAQYDGPLYVYSLDRVTANLERLRGALAETGCDARVYFAMKANRYAPLLQRLAGSGHCGADICSPNELDHALACGFAASDISFTGTGVSNRDLDRLLAQPDLHINCDSIGMIRRIGERSPGRAIGIRINPGIGTGYAGSEQLTYAGATTKFGIYSEQWRDALDMARRHDLTVRTIHFHVGCGYLNNELGRWDEALGAASDFIAEAPDVTTVNVGGGLGLPHRDSDVVLDLTRWATILRRRFHGRGLALAIEPGDYLVKDAGMLVLEVTDIERKRDTLFVSVAGGFNLHPEPVFYGLPCEPVACLPSEIPRERWQRVTIAGNINEAGDIWARNVAMPPLAEGQFIAFLNAGGYGAAMHSNHCMRGDLREMHI